MTTPPTPEGNHDFAFRLPAISDTTIRFSREHPRDFDTLFTDLQQAHPNVARYVLTRAEQLAPAQIQSKEALARLALEVLGLFATQQEVNDLEAMLEALPMGDPVEIPDFTTPDENMSERPPAA